MASAETSQIGQRRHRTCGGPSCLTVPVFEIPEGALPAAQCRPELSRNCRHLRATYNRNDHAGFDHHIVHGDEQSSSLEYTAAIPFRSFYGFGYMRALIAANCAITASSTIFVKRGTFSPSTRPVQKTCAAGVSRKVRRSGKRTPSTYNGRYTS
jgi:hypothetical protein